MKTSNIIAAALVICSAALNAQTENKPATGKNEVKVHIRKVENNNGIEKITDTTYTTSDLSDVSIPGQNIKVIHNGGKADIVLIDEVASGSGILTATDEMNKEIEKAIKEAGIEMDLKDNPSAVIIKHNGTEGKEMRYEKKIVKVVMIRTDVKDATDAERKQAGIAEPKSKLVIDDMNCTPNPSSGNFNLKFSSPDKGNAEISIRDINGKVVYSESVKDFSGSYSKEIDLNQTAKGIYFVTITQGAKAATKKLVVE